MTDELADGWADCQLGDLIDGFQAGRNLSAQGRPARPEEFGVLRISAVTWGAFRPGENKALLDGDKPKPQEVVKRGDLLITRANTSDLVGAVVLVDEDHPTLMLPDKILRVLPKPGAVDPRFLLHALRSAAARDHFARNATGTSDSMRNLSQPKLSATPVRLAPFAEQRRIVAKVEALLGQVNAARSKLQTTAHFLGLRLEEGSARVGPVTNAILARAFRGELVPTESELARLEGRVFESATQLLARVHGVERIGQASQGAR